MKIEITKNGPYKVIGKVALSEKKLSSIDGKTEVVHLKDYPTQETTYLCRCGKSKNAPYCDGSHKSVFDGTLQAPYGKPTDHEVVNPEIAVMQNEIKGVSGPLSVSGNMKVFDGDHQYEQKPKVSLCRCGASKNKPFCDGSHQAIGYKDR
ncbi:MAG: CDGSH iron-sulfur domain-containing protein [Acholeplasma sp.]|nr:CDGSH iron-sulfur domain-containing protein [Acholeplasma sp.]